MASKTISQRISLEGSEDIRKKLEELGKSGEQAFKTIQDAAAKPITDPQQIERTKQAIDQLVSAGQGLAQQFQTLTTSSQQFGAAGVQASQQVTGALNQTGKAAEQVGSGLQQSSVKFGAVAGAVAGVFQAATSKLIGIVGQLRAAFSPGALLKGVVDTGKEISDQADKLKATIPEWLTLSKAMDAAGVSQETFIAGTSKLAQKIAEAKGFIELMPGVLVSTSGGVVATMTAIARSISILGDSAQAAALGTKFFGENWKEIIKVLLGGKTALDATDGVFDKLAKIDRALGADQIEKAAQLAKAWEVLGKAVRAFKDQIGTVFLDSALLRAEWLIKLIDRSRELFKTWQGLAEAKKAAFLEGLGDSPAEFLFKTLIALGDQLAGLWRDVLVPAGRQLWALISQMSGSLEGVSKSQVAAFFITAAIAAVGLAVALKGIQIVLAPLMLLFTPFAAILLAVGAAAVLFWDQIAAGAAKAAALIPNELKLIGDSIKALFAGDFKGFWLLFSEAAVSAFNTIGQAIVAAVPAIKTLMDSFGQIAKDLPGAILLAVQTIVGAFVVLGKAAQGVANTINAVFGTELTGTDIGVLVILGQITGAFTILSGIILTVVGVVAGLVTIFGGPLVAAIGGIIALVVILATQFPQAWEVTKGSFLAFVEAFKAGWEIIRAGLQAIADGMNALISVSQTFVEAFKAGWEAIKAGATQAFDAITFAFQKMVDAIVKFVTTAPANAWKWIVDTFNQAMTALGKAIDDKIRKLRELLGLGQQVGSGGGGDPVTGGNAAGGLIGGHARGGLLGGRGSGTSDSNLAWVSRGEHIMPARAVRQPGVLAFLEALRRSGGDLSRVLDGMGRFALGGLALPAFAEGGLTGMSNVTIQFPGLQPIGGLRAPGDVVEELRKAAAMAQVRSGGRKPSRYR